MFCLTGNMLCHACVLTHAQIPASCLGCIAGWLLGFVAGVCPPQLTQLPVWLLSPAESTLRLLCKVFDVETATVSLLTGERIYLVGACGALPVCVCPDRWGFCGWSFLNPNHEVRKTRGFCSWWDCTAGMRACMQGCFVIFC